MAGRLGGSGDPGDGAFDSDESTRLLQRDRLPAKPRPATQPPPLPTGMRARTPTPPNFNPGTVHERAGVPGLPPRPGSVATPEPQSITPQPPQLPPPPMPGATPLPPTAPMAKGAATAAPPGMPMAVPTPPPGQVPAAPVPGPAMAFPATPPPPGPNMSFPATPPPPGPNYPGWNAQPPMPPVVRPEERGPTAPDMYERPVYPQRSSVPVMGFEQSRQTKSLRPWVLIVGALVMAGLAFAITRAFLS